MKYYQILLKNYLNKEITQLVILKNLSINLSLIYAALVIVRLRFLTGKQ